MQKIQIPPAMKKPLRDYEEYCRDWRRLRPTSLKERIRQIAIFLDFLGSRNIKTLDQVQPVDVSAFVTSRHRLRSKTVSRIASDVRWLCNPCRNDERERKDKKDVQVICGQALTSVAGRPCIPSGSVIVILFEIRTLRPCGYYYISIFLNVLQLI
jgi:hypothetical protein